MIKLNNVQRSFSQKSVLNGVNLDIGQGETFLLIGRSGAGKTVLLKTILGLLRPDSGMISIDGQEITQLTKNKLEKIRLKFGLVFQNSALFDFLTVWENVSFFLKQHTNMSKKEMRKKASQTLALVGLADIEDMYPHELSGGMRKRVAIARAIIYNPKIIIYDEPTTGIDPIAVDKIVSLIKDLHNRLSVTSLVVTHDLETGLKIADRVAFLLGGKIIFEGKKEDVKNTQDKRLLQFIHGASGGPIKEMEV
ncbi:MAG: ATP-binding cassette domain-containing protein [Candidatus Omnitrophica bacterium]|nr:ATP-binding cassette domain-containing protein [Candidatus Omnitrophota bacterium]MCF7887933.1 ATP-binding cassette domain-containing protein [Candidatus Omnitrophota bacterium]